MFYTKKMQAKKTKRDDAVQSELGNLLTDKAFAAQFGKYFATPRDKLQGLFKLLGELVSKFDKLREKSGHPPSRLANTNATIYTISEFNNHYYDIEFEVKPTQFKLCILDMNFLKKLTSKRDFNYEEFLQYQFENTKVFYSPEKMLKYFEEFFLQKLPATRSTKSKEFKARLGSFYNVMALPFESIHDRVTKPGAFQDESVQISDYGEWDGLFGYRSYLSPGAYKKRFKFKLRKPSFLYDCDFRFNSGLHQMKREYLDLFAKMVSPIQKLANDIVRLQPGVATILKRKITAGASRRSRKKKLSAGAQRDPKFKQKLKQSQR